MLYKPFLVGLSVCVATTTAFTLPIVGVDVNLQKDKAQYDACKNADPATTFCAIRYGGGPPEPVVYNKCVPWRKNGLIASAVFCQPATCYVFADENCTAGPTTPVPVIVPVSVDFMNFVDFVELLGQSAYCSPNNLPRL